MHTQTHTHTRLFYWQSIGRAGVAGTAGSVLAVPVLPEEVGSNHASRVRMQLSRGGLHRTGLTCSVYCLVLLIHDLILLSKSNREFKHTSTLPLNQLVK